MVSWAVPRLNDGSKDIRHVVLAMQDEFTILISVWSMVDRGDLNHGVGVYPGLYPYTVGMVKWLSGDQASQGSLIRRTRRLSLAVMVLSLIVAFILVERISKNSWVAAAFTIPLALNPETLMWASRVHPDAFLQLFDFGALGLFALHVDTRKPGYLYGATALASLSAGRRSWVCSS